MKKIFLISHLYNNGDYVYIDKNEDNYHHLVRVLRVRIGEKFIIGDKINNEFTSEIININNNQIVLFIKDNYIRKNNIPDITIFFSILKGDKNDLLLEKCTEIGVVRFIPMITKNTVIKILDGENKKIDRWKKIVLEASMQSCSKIIPEIHSIEQFNQIKTYNSFKLKIYGCIKEKSKTLNNILTKIRQNDSIAFFVGPEGDFDENEIKLLNDYGWEGVSLSNNILRSETSAIFTSSVIISNFFN